MRIKICGIRDLATVDAAVDAGADFVGLVFYRLSPRAISPDEAAKLARRARGRSGVVALTVDADDTLFSWIIRAVSPDLLQLHGIETPERVAAIRTRFERPVMKVVSISSQHDLKAVPAYASVADWLLLDARRPKGTIRPGGRGTTFDWSLISQIERTRPVMLSGGLNPDNVGEAIESVRPDGVDVSSGVETGLGAKDPKKMAAFVRAARHATARLMGKSATSHA